MHEGNGQEKRLTRRGMLGVVVSTAGAAILAACGDAATGGTATSAVATVAKAANTAASAATAAAPTTNAAAGTVAGAATGAAPAVNSAAATVASVATGAAPTVNAAAGTVAGAATSAAPTVNAAAGTVTGAATTSAPAMVTAAASSGAVPAIPIPDLSKYKGQTLQMVSKTEYFKGTEMALDMALQDFASKTGIKIENNRSNQDMGDTATKIDASVKAGNPPDLLYFDRFLSQFQQLGDLTELTDVVGKAQDAYGAVEDGAVINQRFDGKYFSLPYFANANGWFARKDWLAEKGIKPTDIKTFEQLRDAALMISDPAKNRYGWGMTTNASGDGSSDILSVINAYGGAVTSDDGKKVVFNSPETLAGVQFLADIFTNPKYKPMLPPGINSWTDTSNNEAWLAGTIGFTNNGYTLYAQSFNTKNPVYMQTAILPGFLGPATDQVIATPASGYLAIPKGAKNAELAKAVALYLIGGPAFLALAKPSLGLILPVYKKLWMQDPFYSSGDPSFAALQQIIEGKLPIKSKSGFNFPQAPSPIYEDAINGQRVTSDMMGEIIQKGVKPQDAIKTATDRMIKSAEQLGLKQ